MFHFRGILNLGKPGNLVKGLVEGQGAWYGPGMLKGLPGKRLASDFGENKSAMSLDAKTQPNNARDVNHL